MKKQAELESPSTNFDVNRLQKPAGFDVLAEQFMAEFVDKPIHELRSEMQATPEAIVAYNAKLRFFQFATVLLAVMNEEHKNPEYSPIRTELERQFLPPTFARGANVFDEIRSAMTSLSDLMTPRENPHHLTWSLKWFESVGIEENNPVVLHSFGTRWLAFFTTLTKALRSFNPG
jgi:hypothetical protein